MKYDIVVIGGGHAGVEASLAAARMGAKTLLTTLNIKMIANMPCNPSIGGSAKGIVVREVDALGGIMGFACDHTYLQMKMLNTGKGPGVQCLRAQADKHDYPHYIQQVCLNTPNLDVKECEIIDVLYNDVKEITGVKTTKGEIIDCSCVILTTGTFMNSEILAGNNKYSGGPDGENPSIGLSDNLDKMGIKLIRLKTGTPSRIKKSTIDFSKTQIETGTKGELAFSYLTNSFIPFEEQLPCHLIYTTPKTHEIILSNLSKSAQFNGLVIGVGPRYCPSIEGKLTTFKDKPRHQLFLEPEYRDGESIYLQGFSTSMPHDVQDEMVRSLPGLENAEILKYAYAIEYDSLDPLEFDLTLAVKKYKGLYGAGQICGTSGYEEAAGLGLMAGVNAVLYLRKQEPFILKRNESYIGVMIDDIVTKGVSEPYRLLSSRAEYRLLLRHDNADLRLMDYAYKYNLIDQKRYDDYLNKNKSIEEAKDFLKNYTIRGNDVINNFLVSKGYSKLVGGINALDLLKRPNVSLSELKELIEEKDRLNLSNIAIMQLDIMIKYEGYIKKQAKDAASFSKYEDITIPNDIDYLHLDGLALEARQKFDKIKPLTIGQASRISGITPCDISVLAMHIRKVS